MITALLIMTGCSSEDKTIVGISWCEDITVAESEY